MKPFIRKRPGWCATCAVALGLAFGTAQASDMQPGAQIWKNSEGVWCWNREFVAATPPANCGDSQLVGQAAAPAPYVTPAALPVQPLAVAPVTAPPPVQTPYVAPVATPVAAERAPKVDRH